MAIRMYRKWYLRITAMYLSQLTMRYYRTHTHTYTKWRNSIVRKSLTYQSDVFGMPRNRNRIVGCFAIVDILSHLVVVMTYPKLSI